MEGFFGNQTSQSEVKASIVSQYFWSWAKIIDSKHPSPTLAYLDLFAGPGRYEDGNASTPLRVIQSVVGDRGLCKSAILQFTDADAEHIRTLSVEAGLVDGYKGIWNEPTFSVAEYGDAVAGSVRETANRMPSLVFVDPFGYKVLALDFINEVLAGSGSEVIFFFNYRRINAALSNGVLFAGLGRLFGEAAVDRLYARLRSEGLSPERRERMIVRAIERAIEGDDSSHGGRRYVRPFRFWNDNGTRITHHLIHATTHPLGHGVMKDIMSTHSTNIGGVPTYEFRRPDRLSGQTSMEADLSIVALADDLLVRFAGLSIRVLDIYKRDHPRRPYTKGNYKSALMRLSALSQISVRHSRPVRSGTMPDAAVVTFPARS